MKESSQFNSLNEDKRTLNSQYSKEYYIFNLSGGRKKVNILLSDILLVRAIKGSHADKLLYLKGNIIHTIRGHRLNDIIEITGFLLQVNKQELVSPVAINYIGEETIYLKDLTDNDKPIYICLNKTYKTAFFDFFNHPKNVNKRS